MSAGCASCASCASYASGGVSRGGMVLVGLDNLLDLVNDSRHVEDFVFGQFCVV